MPFEYEHHFIEYEYVHFWALRGIIAGNRWFPAFSYSVRRGGRYSYSYSLLEFLTRLGANTIFNAFESVSRRKLTGSVSQAPFE